MTHDPDPDPRLDRALDRALADGAPRLAHRSPELRRDLVDLARESTRPRRRTPLRLAVVGGTAAVVLGTGGLAVAAGVLPGWTDFRPSAGDVRCAVDLDVRAANGDGEPGPAFSEVEEQRVLEAARAYLDGYDYDGVDREAAVRELRAEQRERRDELSLAELADEAPYQVGAELEVQAVQRHVVEDLVAHLDAEGLDHRAVLVSGGERCQER